MDINSLQVNIRTTVSGYVYTSIQEIVFKPTSEIIDWDVNQTVKHLLTDVTRNIDDIYNTITYVTRNLNQKHKFIIMGYSNWISFQHNYKLQHYISVIKGLQQ